MLIDGSSLFIEDFMSLAEFIDHCRVCMQIYCCMTYGDTKQE